MCVSVCVSECVSECVSADMSPYCSVHDEWMIMKFSKDVLPCSKEGKRALAPYPFLCYHFANLCGVPSTASLSIFNQNFCLDG